MRISSLIFLSFLLVLILFATTTYINYRQSEKVKENAEYLTASTNIVRNGNRLQRNVLNRVSVLRGFLLTGEASFLQAYDTSAKENESILKELSMSFEDSSLQKKLLYQIIDLDNRWEKEFAIPLREARINAEVSMKDSLSFNRLYREKNRAGLEQDLNNALQQKIRAFINLEYDRRDRQRQILSASVQRTRNISFTLTVASVIAAFFIVGFLSFRISSRLQKMVEMADSIAAGNYEVHTDATGHDEVSRLGRSLNSMASVLSRNITELKTRNSELDQFAHIVSHDMKAPLRGIGNVVSWIEEDHGAELSPKLSEYVVLIRGRTRRGENLIQGLLSYARIGREKTEKEMVDVAAMVQEILENFSTGHTIETDTGLPVFFTERLPLFQVFSNLISNAVKYNTRPQGTIRIYAEDYTDHYLFSVADNGPGIHKNYHDKIFVIFQTLREKDDPESTGVGLAIVKKILDARHEKIMIRSSPGEGATFSFTWKK